MQAQQTTKKYQPSVGVVLRRGDGRVLMCRRNGGGEYAWQFPEGAALPGEVPQAIAWRTLGEQLGLDRPEQICRLVGRGPTTRVPFCKPARGLIGKEHTFLLLDFAGDDAKLAPRSAQFDDWRWVTPEEAVDLVVPSRSQAIRTTLEAAASTPQPA